MGKEEDNNILRNIGDCMENLERSIEACNASDAIKAASCASGNIEIAFYNKQINKEKANLIRGTISDFGETFSNKCGCLNR